MAIRSHPTRGSAQVHCHVCGNWFDYPIHAHDGGPLDGHINELLHRCQSGSHDQDTVNSFIGTDGFRHIVVNEDEVKAHWSEKGHTYPRSSIPDAHACHPDSAAYAQLTKKLSPSKSAK